MKKTTAENGPGCGADLVTDSPKSYEDSKSHGDQNSMLVPAFTYEVIIYPGQQGPQFLLTALWSSFHLWVFQFELRYT